jgi:hypothetical protein
MHSGASISKAEGFAAPQESIFTLIAPALHEAPTYQKNSKAGSPLAAYRIGSPEALQNLQCKKSSKPLISRVGGTG